MAAPVPSGEQLRQHLGRLPQELYDKIFDLAFTPDSRLREITYEHYKPPAQLQVDRAIRKQFTKAYYDEPATFTMEYSNDKWALFATFDECLEWLNSLALETRGTIHRIVIPLADFEDFVFCPQDDPRDAARDWAQYMHMMIDELGMALELYVEWAHPRCDIMWIVFQRKGQDGLLQRMSMTDIYYTRYGWKRAR